MNNTVNNSNPYSKTNAVIVGTTGLVGALAGLGKSHFIDRPDVQKGLEREFQNYKNAIRLNEINISDVFERTQKNQELKNNFNSLCDYWYNTGLKKAKKKNIIFGILAGITISTIGIAVKNIRNKQKGNSNETVTNKS